jgi:hypothetical protein
VGTHPRPGPSVQAPARGGVQFTRTPNVKTALVRLNVFLFLSEVPPEDTPPTFSVEVKRFTSERLDQSHSASIYWCSVDVPFESISGGFTVTIGSFNAIVDLTQTVPSMIQDSFHPDLIPAFLSDIKDNEWQTLSRLATLPHQFSRHFFDAAKRSPSSLVRQLFELQPLGQRRNALSLLDYARDFFGHFDPQAEFSVPQKFLIDLALKHFHSFVLFGPITLTQISLIKLSKFDIIPLNLPFENNLAYFEKNIELLEDFSLFETSPNLLIAAYQAAFHKRFVALAKQWMGAVVPLRKNIDVFWAFYRRLQSVPNLGKPPSFVTLFAEFVALLFPDLAGFLETKMDEFTFEELGDAVQDTEKAGENEEKLVGEFLAIREEKEARDFRTGKEPGLVLRILAPLRLLRQASNL